MVTELSRAQAPPATNQPPCPRHPAPWAGHQSSNRSASSWPREKGNLPLRRFDHQKLGARVATLILRKPALPALRKMSPRNLKGRIQNLGSGLLHKFKPL